MTRVQAWNEFVSPKFYGPLTIWPWLKISPQTSSNVIYLIITAWQWLMSFPYIPCIPMQIKPIKACQDKGGVLSPWESGCAVPFPPQDSVVHVNLSHLSHNAVETACQWLRQFFSLFPLFLKLEHFQMIKNHLTDKRKMLQLSFGNEFSFQ